MSKLKIGDRVRILHDAICMTSRHVVNVWAYKSAIGYVGKISDILKDSKYPYKIIGLPKECGNLNYRKDQIELVKPSIKYLPFNKAWKALLKGKTIAIKGSHETYKLKDHILVYEDGWETAYFPIKDMLRDDWYISNDY